MSVLIQRITNGINIIIRYFGELNGPQGTEVLSVGAKSNFKVEELYLEDVVARYHQDLPPSAVWNILHAMADLSNLSVEEMLKQDEK